MSTATLTRPRRTRAYVAPATETWVPRAFILGRVSQVRGRDKLGDAFHSPSEQEAAGRRVVAERGGEVIDVKIDLDRSGASFTKREGFDRAVELAKAGKIDAVVIYDLSRFGRNVIESLVWLRRLKDMGVEVWSAREEVDIDSPAGKLTTVMFLAIAELFYDQSKERWSNLIQQRVENGYHHGNPPPGYDLVPKVGLVPNQHAQAVKGILRAYANFAPTSQLAKQFSAVSGRFVTRQVIYRMVRNPIYIGKISIKGVEYDGRHKALVDKRTWARIQQRVARDKEVGPRSKAGKLAHEFSGLLGCEKCRASVSSIKDVARVGDKRLRCYLQHEKNRHTTPRRCTGIGAPSLSGLRAIVLDLMRQRARDLVLDDGLAAQLTAKVNDAKRELGGIRSRMTALEDEIAVLIRDSKKTNAQRARRGKLENAAYARALGQAEAEYGALTDRHAELVTWINAEPEVDISVLALRFEDALDAWDEMTITERNATLRFLIERIWIAPPAQPHRDPLGPHRVTIDWRN